MKASRLFNLRSAISAVAILMAIYSVESSAYVRPGDPPPVGGIRAYPGERVERERPYPVRPGPVRPGPIRPDPRPYPPPPPPPPPPVCRDSGVMNDIDSMQYKVDRVSHGKCAGYDKWTVRNCADNLESHAVDATKAAMRSTLRQIRDEVESICRDSYNCSYYEVNRVVDRFEDLIYRIRNTDMVYDGGAGRTSIIEDVEYFRARCR